MAVSAPTSLFVSHNNSVSNTYTSAGISISSGTNLALTAIVALTAGDDTSVAAFWDSGGTNQAFTQIGTANASSADTITFFGLTGVTTQTGSPTFNCTWTGGAPQAIAISIASWTGVDQTGGATTFYGFSSTSGTATGTQPSLATGSSIAVGDMAVDGACSVACTITAPTQTSLNTDQAGIEGVASSYPSGGGAGSAITFAWSATAGLWCQAAMGIKAVAGSSIKYRKTLSPIGTRAGSRQLWNS